MNEAKQTPGLYPWMNFTETETVIKTISDKLSVENFNITTDETEFLEYRAIC